MTLERVPEGIPHVPVGGTAADREVGSTAGPGAGPTGRVADAARLQILATEHWSLLATRSMGYQESFSRAAMFLSVLSGASCRSRWWRRR